MVSIVADNRDAERALQKLLALVQQAGAVFRDDVVVRCVDGALSIEASPHGVGDVLMRLPWDCLVPLQPFRLAVDGDEIVIARRDDGLTPACVGLMEAFLELYNLTDKIAIHRRTSPWPLIVSDPRLLTAVTQGRGRGAYVLSGNLQLAGHENELVLQSFLNSRAFDYKALSENITGIPINLRVLLPILDAMNHHFLGAAYSYEQRGEDRQVTTARSVPLPQCGDQCFACYGKHDGFDTWLTYGFIDDSVPFVGSVGMTIDLPDCGTIRVGNMIHNRLPGELPDADSDLYFYVPKVLAAAGNHRDVASLLIPGAGAPRALRRTLDLLIGEMRPDRPRRPELVLRAEEQILAANRSYYWNLAALLRSLSPADPRQLPIRDNFIRMCAGQLARIESYHRLPKG